MSASNAFGKSESKSKSKTFQFDFTELEKELQGINLGVVMEQFGILMEQVDFQRQAFGVMSPMMQQMLAQQTRESELFTDEEQQQRMLDQITRQDNMFAAQDELLQSQLDLIRQESGATEDQMALINSATEAQIASGEADIQAFGRDTMQMISQELAPGRGLRPTDTPIQDRAFDVGGEMARQQGRLISDLRGQQAQAQLNFPLAANQQRASMMQFQQQLGQSASDFQNQLQQQAFQNRLNLFGQVGQLGLGLSGGGQPFSNLQQAFRPQVGQKSKGSSETLNLSSSGSFSSRELKHEIRKIDNANILHALLSIPVEMWKYRLSEYGPAVDHIGPYAEDFAKAFGIGDGKTINYMDFLGVLAASVQALTKRVRELEEGGV